MHLLYAPCKIFQKNHANLWTFFESKDIFLDFSFSGKKNGETK